MVSQCWNRNVCERPNVVWDRYALLQAGLVNQQGDDCPYEQTPDRRKIARKKTNVFRGRLLRHRTQTLLNAMAELLTYPIERLVERGRGLTDVVGDFANCSASGVRCSDQAS